MNQLCLVVMIGLAIVTAPSVVEAQTAVDGDTIRLDGTTYRLWGIDAPELAQACTGWAAGVEATRALAAMMSGKTVTCEPRTRDRYGRTVAVCRAGGMDLAAAMVRAGMACAFVRYARDYVIEEDSAKRAGLGVHGHPCVAAWDWRVQQRSR